MGRVYHILCFGCSECGELLQGKPFYAVDGKPLCQVGGGVCVCVCVFGCLGVCVCVWVCV